MLASCKKVKHQARTYKQKMLIINKIKNDGESISNVMKQFNIKQSTISAIIKSSETIESKTKENPMLLKKKRIKPPKHQRLEQAVILWTRQMRTGKVPLTGNIIKEKALQFAESMGINEFKASNGWIDNFRKRNDISWRVIAGDSDSVDHEFTDDWINSELLPILADYAQKDVFNLDEFGLFWKATPNKTMSFRGENCCDGKFSKERISVLVGANMTG